MKAIFGSLAVFATAFGGAVDAQDVEWETRIDEAELEQGELHLGLYLAGERDGFMRLGWWRDGDALRIWDRTMLASQEIYETYEAEVAAVDLAPRSVAIRFHTGSAEMRLDASFDGRAGAGQVTINRPGSALASRDVSVELGEGVILRASSFVLAGLLELQPGEFVQLDWYSPLSGAQESVTLTAMEMIEVETPAGRFDTIRIEQRGGTPANDIFVEQGTGRIVRIDIGGQPMQFLALPDAEPAP